jgi:general transcription factor 3C polypeptide 2
LKNAQFQANNHSMASLGMKTLRSRTVIGFPFSQINRVRFNENQQAHKFYALGYQAGFVRIKKLQTGKPKA